MEISAMISELKNESVTVCKTLRCKETEANTLRDRLHTLDAEIQTLADRFDALKMAIDSLELIAPTQQTATIADTPVTVPAVPGKKIKNIHHSRLPRRIGKYNANGKQIGEYCSINRAAKLHGWSNNAMRHYIDKVPKEKQIKLRGYYLEFIAA